MNTIKISAIRTLCLLLISLLLNFIQLKGQTTQRITKPLIGASQMCISTTNYSNYLSYAFSSNVTNSGSVPSHFVELSNENALITPREVGSFSPSLNIIYLNSLDINGQNLPAGTGYRIRIFSKTPSVYSEYSDSFTIIANPPVPTLNISGGVSLCPGVSQTLTVTNPSNSYTYQWQRYSYDISNATGTSYTPTSESYYSVKAISTNGCSTASNNVSVSFSSLPSSNISLSDFSYGSSGSTIFLKPYQSFNLSVGIFGGRQPFSYTLSDGTTNTTETNVNYGKSYTFSAPATGSRTYTLTTITDACGSQVNNSSMGRARIKESPYCAPLSYGTYGIRSFSIQGTAISNLNSGRSLDGWEEYLTPANINANVNYNFMIASLTPSIPRYFTIWADLNQSGTFDTNERIFPTGNTSVTVSTPYNSVIKLPTSTFNGQIRLRVILSSDGYYALTYPCYPTSYGEIEDYVLNVYNGTIPTVIETDSMPRFGVCKNTPFPVKFTFSGTPPPSNITYKVEGSYSSDFSNPITLGTGSSSPIMCINGNNTGYYSYLNVRVVPVGTLPNRITKQAPNALLTKEKPSVQLYASIFPNSIYNRWGYGYKSLSVANNTPIAVYGNTGVYNNTLTSIKLSDDRVFSSSNGLIKIDSTIIANGITKFKLIESSDNTCTNTTADSVIISAGNPYLKIVKVRGSVDTTSISRLCGGFYVTFAGEYLDTLSYKFYHVQISDANGSFANPVDIGHTCITKVLTEAEGGQNISCYVPSQIPAGTGYKLRVIKKSANLFSPVFERDFEVTNNDITAAAHFLRDQINEGEVTTLNVRFTGGAPPYRIYLTSDGSSNSYSTTNNESSMSINLAPFYSQRFYYNYSNNCQNYSSTSSNLYLNVRTLDKDNAQWYVKPFQESPYNELLSKTAIVYNSDTLFKRPFINYTSSIKNGYFDYNSSALQLPATVLRTGETYSLVQRLNPDYSGSSPLQNLLTGIWLDINQDGDFEDAGEELAINPFANHWVGNQVQNFVIPSNVNLGFTRMRVRVVSKGYNAAVFAMEASNPIDRYANTYDIPVVILSNSVTALMATPKITGNTLCNGNTFSVDFSKYGMAANTQYTIQLSDENGSFGLQPTIIGTGTTPPINVTLPLNMNNGNYTIRVNSNGTISPNSPAFNVSINKEISMVDGDWHANSTWSCGRVPTLVDMVTIAEGTTVTVFSGDARVNSLIANGILSFLNGTKLMFR